jgi:flagellar basal-body rod protein FlgG
VASDPVRGVLLQSRSILLNNLLNADSAGFRRSEPILADLSYDDQEHTTDGSLLQRNRSAAKPGVQWIGRRLDLTEGTCRPTGGTLDLAIQGDGFFIVRDAERQFYTRCGRFRIGTDRRLVLPIGDAEFRLEPAIVIPADASELLVDSSGVVSARTSSAAQPVKIGRVSLARFLDPTGLVPAGRCLLTAGPAAGLVRQAPPGDDAGIILQGRLESSNVDRDQERERLRQLDELLDLLAKPAR